MDTVRFALAQMNPVVGDCAGNAEKILDFARKAAEGGASLVVTPELSLCGYPPEDLVLREEFLAACRAELESLAARLEEAGCPPAVVGFPEKDEGRIYNAAALLRGGRVEGIYRKHKLPEYGVFDEPRLFSEGSEPFVFRIGGIRAGLLICEDTWYPEPALEAWGAGAELIVSVNASPFSVGKDAERLAAARSNVTSAGLPLIYVNIAGGQDELVFDGRSFVLSAEGEPVSQLPACEECLGFVSYGPEGFGSASHPPAEASEAETVYEVLKTAVRDYIGKNRFPGAIVGLSGGVDSALVLCIAADALGPERVRAVMMPTRFTADMSREDAETLAKNLGVRYDVIPVGGVFDTYMELLAPHFEGKPWDATEENIQARVRGMILMALSNKTGSLVLTTGNKSETAVGYSTLYGDLAGGFAVIKDVLKTRVYELCRWRNSVSAVIPERILTRAPSAELREGQKDQDSLPDYAVLDAIISAYVEKRLPRAAIEEMPGMKPETVRRIIALIHRNEYKRRQSPVGPKITVLGFGRDWRYPMTGRFTF